MNKEYAVNSKGTNNSETSEVQRVIDIVYNTLMDIECKRTGVNPRFIENMAYYRYALKTALNREGFDVALFATDHVPFDVDPDDNDVVEDEDTETPFSICFNPFIR